MEGTETCIFIFRTELMNLGLITRERELTESYAGNLLIGSLNFKEEKYQRKSYFIG